MHEVLEVVTAAETERGCWLSGVREAGSGELLFNGDGVSVPQDEGSHGPGWCDGRTMM